MNAIPKPLGIKQLGMVWYTIKISQSISVIKCLYAVNTFSSVAEHCLYRQNAQHYRLLTLDLEDYSPIS